jgi:hypothetical protein
MEALRSFEKLGATHPLTQCYIPECLSRQNTEYVDRMSCDRIPESLYQATRLLVSLDSIRYFNSNIVIFFYKMVVKEVYVTVSGYIYSKYNTC